jgi:hypothetical protein
MAMRNSLNRRTRTRIYGGVAGEDGRPSPLCRFLDWNFELTAELALRSFPQVNPCSTGSRGPEFESAFLVR